MMNSNRTEGFELVSLADEHVESVAELETMCFSSPISEANIRNFFVGGIGNGFVLIDTKSSKVVAYGGVIVSADVAQILNIATHPDFRGRGFARNILEEIISYSQNRGACFISLEVRESNSIAIGLYKSCGFYEVGRLKQYYKHPSEDALILERDLAPQ